VAITTANPPSPHSPNPTQNQGSNDDQEARDAEIDPESHKDGNRPVSLTPEAIRSPSSQGSSDDQHGNGHNEPITNEVTATLMAGPDGALWVTVDGADVQQLAARITAVCDVLISAQPPQ
jgi:hypothetical protein